MLGLLLSIPLFFASLVAPPVELTLEHACTSESRTWGLMGRVELPVDHGMLFHWSDDRPRTMWMFNTYMDLDAAVLNADGIILEIYHLQAHPEWMDPTRPVYCLGDLYPSSDPIVQWYDQCSVTSRYPARYVLEMPAGWFAYYEITPGARLQWHGYHGIIVR